MSSINVTLICFSSRNVTDPPRVVAAGEMAGTAGEAEPYRRGSRAIGVSIPRGVPYPMFIAVAVAGSTATDRTLKQYGEFAKPAKTETNSVEKQLKVISYGDFVAMSVTVDFSSK